MVICATGASEANTVPALRDRFVTSARLSGYVGVLEAVLAPVYLSAAFTLKSWVNRFVC